MRRLFWCGLAAIVVATAGFWLTASYVVGHPESLLTRWAAAMFRLGTDPIMQIGRKAVQGADRVAIRVIVGREQNAEDAKVCVPDEPQAIEEEPTIVLEPLSPPADKIMQAAHEEPSLLSADTEPPLADEPKAAPEDWIIERNKIGEKMPRWLDEDDLFGSPEDTDNPKQSGAEEESAPCQEDPAYHYQYPGCPFTGKSPFVDFPASRSDAWSRLKNSKNPVPEFDPSSLYVPERLQRLLPQAGWPEEEEEGDVLSPPTVDTTEFRPSDAKPGEFDPKPM